MRFEWPLALLTLALVPAAAYAYVLVERRRSRYALRFTNLDVLASVVEAAPPWRRLTPPALFLLALMAALLAAARPEVARTTTLEQAAVVLTIDTSGSMLADDVRPNRIGAAREAAKRFVQRLPGKFRVGLVALSTEPRVVMPLTKARAIVLESLDRLRAFGGTSIGDAIARSVDLLRPVTGGENASATVERTAGTATGPLAAIVLLSDGEQRGGRLQPLEGAARAKSAGVPIYTVALGTPGGTIRVSEGGFVQVLPVPPDPETLRQIAAETGGEFFAAGSEERLNAVYESLASRLGTKREFKEATFAFLGTAAALLLGAGVLSARWLGRLP